MTHFEPPIEKPILEVYSHEKEELLRRLTDEDLLLELRRRKRLARVQSEWVLEGWRIDHDAAPPQSYILDDLMKNIAYGISRDISSGRTKLPGMKIESGRFESPFGPRPESSALDIRYFIPFNFVVEKP
jgi:hypothetical protein